MEVTAGLHGRLKVSCPTPGPSNSERFIEAANWRDAMKNLCVVAMLAATLAGGTLESASAQSAPKTGIKNVVLVHGAFADGSGWLAVAKLLKKDGYRVSVPQPPETSYAEDQKYTKAAIDAMDGPVVLPTCLIRRKQPSSSKRLPSPYTS